MILLPVISFLSISLLCCKGLPVQTTQESISSDKADTISLIHPDHIIFLWLENKGFKTIIGSRSAPFLNSLLKKGTLFTNTYATTHPSYPNYIVVLFITSRTLSIHYL